MTVRHNPLLAVALLLSGVGVLCVALWLPHLRDDLGTQQAVLHRLELQSRVVSAATVAPFSQNESRLQKFYENLGESRYAEQQLKTLFAVAAKKNLKLNEGEYKLSEEKNSDTVVYQIQLPVTGPYAAIREFCEEVLQTVPFASLDEISFKRDVIGKNNLDAKLRLTLYLHGDQKVVQP